MRMPLALALFSALAGAQELYALESISIGDGTGVAVSDAGDVNNDGVPDVVIGAWRDDTNGLDAGRAFVVSGVDGSTIWSKIGTRPGDCFGRSVAGVGDLNGDSFDEFAVGAPYEHAAVSTCGAVSVFSGQSGALMYSWNPNVTNALGGWSVASAGDVNNDGTPDVIYGAPGFTISGFPSAGRAFVHSGVNGSLIRTHSGIEAFSYFGYSVDGAGNLNGNGFHAVIVGAYARNLNNQTNVGRAHVFRGLTGTQMWVWDGDGAGDEFGRAVAGAGDVNNDGVGDLIVGAWGDDNNGLESGSARVFSGATGQIIFTVHGTQPGALLGCSVGAAGDVNGDSFDDVLIGSQSEDTPILNAGRVRIISGADGTTVLRTISGTTASAYTGYSVSGAGDVDLDGQTDWIVGAPGVVPLAQGTGHARIVTAGPWRDLGFPMLGTNGLPVLNGSGPLTDSSSIYTISLRGGLPFGNATLIAGLSQINFPFKGGTLVPSPDLLLSGFPLDGSGDIEFGGEWLDGVPSGFEFFLQFWFQDPAGPKNLVCSNGVGAITP